MGYLYRLVLTLNATSWMVVIYGVSKQWSVAKLPIWVTGILLMLIPIILSLFSLIIAKGLGNDSLNNCHECSLADNEFIPTYLGYFFVSLSAADNLTIIIVPGLVIRNKKDMSFEYLKRINDTTYLVLRGKHS